MKPIAPLHDDWRDGLIGVIALLLTLMLWAMLFAPAAI